MCTFAYDELVAREHARDNSRLPAPVAPEPPAPVNLNGSNFYTALETGAIFIALPREAWRSAGTCVCHVCKASNASEAFWDTLVIPGRNDKGTYAFTVHMPELHRQAASLRNPHGERWLVPGREAYDF